MLWGNFSRHFCVFRKDGNDKKSVLEKSETNKIIKQISNATETGTEKSKKEEFCALKYNKKRKILCAEQVKSKPRGNYRKVYTSDII